MNPAFVKFMQGLRRPRSDWQSYLCRVDCELASIFVNLGLANIAPLHDAPKLVWLWITMKHPRKNGLSSDGEFSGLCKFEDELEKTISAHASTFYVGRITSRGRREFYFYVSDNLNFNAALDNFLQTYPNSYFQLGEKMDKRWRHYFEVLLPDQSGIEQIEKNS